MQVNFKFEYNITHYESHGILKITFIILNFDKFNCSQYIIFLLHANFTVDPILPGTSVYALIYEDKYDWDH